MSEQSGTSQRRWVGRHPLAFIGTVLTLVALAQLFFALVLDLFTGISNSYAGLILYGILPGLLAIGLALIGIGGWLYRRAHGEHARWVVDWGEPRDRATAVGVAVVVLMSGSAVAGATHHALVYMDSTPFCAEVCHEVMAPQSIPHQLSAHAQIRCTECHVAPGVSGFLRAKLGGVRQVWETMRRIYHRPIVVPDMAAVPDPGVCQRCHNAEQAYGKVTRTFSTFAADETNRRTDTTLHMRVGSPETGIHHHISMDVEFLSSDGGRTIERVRVRYPDGARGEFKVSVPPEKPVASRGVWRKLTCIDCHNRVGHDVLSFEGRVDRALALGTLPASDPGLKKRVMEITGSEDTVPDRRRFEETYRKLAELARGDALLAPAGKPETLPRLYAASFFPKMKVGPATYPGYRGHEGCFRCHGALEPVDTRRPAPANDCGLCHSQP